MPYFFTTKGIFRMKDILTKRKFTRLTAILLAVAVIFGTMFALPVSAASGDKVTITFDYCYGAMRS